MLNKIKKYRRGKLNFHFETHRSVFIVGAILMFIFFTPLISAYDFGIDNYKKVNSLKEIEIWDNSFFGDAQLSTLNLNSELNEKVRGGYQKVGEFKIKSFEDYNDIIKQIKTYDLNDGMKEIEREIDIKYLDYENVMVNDYKEVCVVLKNSSLNCEDKIVGSHEELKEVWLDFGKDVKKGDEIIIGLFTNVQKGDYVEWIPTINNIEITEWASWDYLGNFTLSEVGTVRGVASNDTYIWVTDRDNDQVWKYNMSLDYTGDNWDTAGVGSDAPAGITTDGNYIWVVDATDDKVYRYTMAGVSSGSWSTAPNSAPLGIITNGSFIWVTSGNNVSKFQMDGTYVENLNLVGDNTNSFGITTDNNYFWVADINDDLVYKYYMNMTYTGDNFSITEIGASEQTGLDIGNESFWIGKHSGGVFKYEYSSDESPSITLNSPEDYLNQTSQSLTFNCSATDDNLIENVSLYINGVLNYTETDGVNNFTEIYKTLTFADGDYNWTCITYDNKTQEGTTDTRFFTISDLFENSQTYKASITEGSTGNFTANITYASSNWDLITASLWYNHYRGVSAPDVSGTTNVPFNWRIGLTNSTGTTYHNLTNYTQSVSTVNMSYCGVTYSTCFINFTFYNEETLEIVNGTIDLTFNYRASTSPSSFNDVFSYTNSSLDVQSHKFCFNPADETFIVDAIISYSYPGYTNKFYNFEGIEFTNDTTEIGLFLLNSGNSTSFFIEVLDNNYYPIEGVEIYVQRYYPETNTWNTIEILETNDNGETIQHLYTEDALYRFKVYDDGTLLHTTATSTIACKETPCTITIIIPTTIGNIYDSKTNLDTSLTMDASYLISYTYSDTSGNFSSARLEVTRNSLGENSLQPVCNSTSSSSTAILTCNLLTETNGTYVAKGFITRSGESEDNIERKVFYKIRDIISGVGLDGLLWSIFFLMGIVMLGIYRPSMAIIFAIVGVIFLQLLQLMEISKTAIVALIGIGIVLLVEVRKQ